MTSQPEIFENIENLAGNLKMKLGDATTDKKVVAIYAFNATGKTRLSNFLNGENESGEALEDEDREALEDENGETIEEEGKIKTLCYNAFLEDIFIWDNDDYVLKFNLKSWFMNVIKGQSLDRRVVENFTDIVNHNGLKLEPSIDFTDEDKNGNYREHGEVSFKIASGDSESADNIKISKGEESIFIWSVFYTILEAAISELILKEENRTTDIFNNLECIIIDDPVSSIDDTRIISIALKLVELIRDDQVEKHLEKTKIELEKQEDFSFEYIRTRLEEIRSEYYEELKLKFLLTTHHALYYNVLVNSFRLQARSNKFLSYSLSRENNNLKLVKQGDAPFSYHLAVKELIKKVINDDLIEKFHFNLLRALLEKTANFLGYENWYDCITGVNKQESTRLLNNYSHSRLSDLESNELSSRDKEIFITTFNEFVEKFKYNYKFMTNKDINLIAESNQSTVVAEFIPSKKRAEHYQSEDALEKEFIAQLQKQAYEYLKITNNDDLKDNLRTQLEKLNNYHFSDNEWMYFFEKEISNTAQGIEEKTVTIQEDFIKILVCDDGTEKNIYLLDKKNIHNNSLQVINQYATDKGVSSNRYDVTVLVNGLPLVHIELKRRGVAIQEAFNQINRYQRESFWADSGLFEYVQMFVISNGTHTKYYSNTTRFSHIKEQKNGKTRKGKRSSNSFEFTSWWADKTNRPITDLIDFAKTFFAKHSLLNILTKYCIYTSDKSLLVMRPYQIVATEKIINRIETSTNYKKYGTIEAGGYVWHTTGSGKTLTSFKTAQLASKLPYIKKVLFIVDRKDLDYQTMKEYDKFEKGAANSNTSTAKFQKQLEDPNAKIIITTIQKLDKFIKKNKGHTIFGGHLVMIFDECHRSQFGDMHKSITKAFNKYHIFGFTGTPIFAVNSTAGKHVDLRTTQQAFGEKLHTYTIVDAIADKNVLPFKVDYISTMKQAENIEDTSISDIDRKKALAAAKRIRNIVKYIREHFDQKTKRNSYYTLKERRLAGFNSIFAVSSIEMAKKYYDEFQKQLQDLPSDKKLKIATIFSYGVNEAEAEVDGMIDENSENTDNLDATSKDFLERAIGDYNDMFQTSYDTSSDKFQNYYKDVSQRVKDREIDILIVVNMFLTGFDATTLNTLWIDKNLQSHGLIQAFSRTNRILNSVKTFGNIVCFRNLEKKTNEAISLFGDKEASGIVLLKSFDEYYNGYTEDEKIVKGYTTLISELQEKFPLGERIISEEAQKEFIKLYGGILKVRNILSSFDKFEGKGILSDRDIQDYHSMYIDLYNEFRKDKDSEKEVINDDLVFEMELIKQVEINIDYIIELIKKYHSGNTKDKEILSDINKAISSSIELRNKKDLIEQFIQSLDISSSVDEEWLSFVEKKKVEELEKIIEEENLNKEETYAFIEKSFREGNVKTTGTSITKIVPKMSRFSPSGEYSKKCSTVTQKFMKFFDRFFDIT